MKTNTIVHRVTKILVDILFFGCLALCVFIPLQIDLLSAYLLILDKPDWVRLALLMIPTLAGVYITWQLKVMFKTLIGGNPFVLRNISAFRRIAAACFAVGVCYAVAFVLWSTIATALVVVICVIAGLFCLTLKDIFKQAYLYKQENDLTV